MKLVLTDTSPEILTVWQAQFLRRPEVDIREGHIFDTQADAFLLPGNSFGFLDSGLALEACERFGWDLQEELRRIIRSEHHGELLVGQAVALRLPSIPCLVIYAPTWRTPRKLDGTVNVYLAARAAFVALGETAGAAGAQGPRSIAVHSLGVKEGGLDPRISARQIRYAYEVSAALRGPGDKNLTQQMRRERKLMSIPGLEQDEGKEAAE